jgi:hypothetical protein
MALLGALAIILAAFVPTFWQLWVTRGEVAGAPVSAPHDAPWEADVTADGAVRALGLRLPGTTLADVQAIWGDSLAVALMAHPSDGGTPHLSLEALVDRARPGGVQGRLHLTLAASPEQLSRWHAAARDPKPLDDGARRFSLRAEDWREALRLPVRSMGFVPQAQLDAQIMRDRFGEPAQIVRESDQLQHWLYPSRGLAIAWDDQGRDVLQYVPPAQFDALLAAPLRQLVPAAKVGQVATAQPAR